MTIGVPDNYTSIQQAINAASPGDTILVHNGTYHENLIINKTIQLIGDNPRTTILDGSTSNATYAPTIEIYSYLNSAENVGVANFTIAGSKTAWGIYVFYPTSSGALIQNNIVINNSGGIHVNGAGNCTFTNNTVTNNKHEGILLIDSEHNTMKNNTLADNPYNFGIYFQGFDQNIDTSNTVNGKPIRYLKNQTLLHINPTTYPEVGYLALVNCTDITVENLTLQNSINGLLLEKTQNSTILNNQINNNSRGVDIINSQNITIQNNNITDNVWQGLALTNSQNNRITSNTLTNNRYNLRIQGPTLNDYTQEIDTSNTIDARPIRYMMDETDLNINPATYPDTGYLALINCHNITAQNLSLEHSDILAAFTQDSTIIQNALTNGTITLTRSTNITVTGNTVTAGDTGISLGDSHNITVTENELSGCADWGIQLSSSANNTLADNNVKNNTSGMDLSASSNNTIFRNNIADNRGYGMTLRDAHYNLAYHNNFTNPMLYQVIVSYGDGQPLSDNTFDNGYPSGGNYWSDYVGVDVKSGPYQNVTGSDGIGDTPYVIDAGNVDHYPLMKPWIPTPATVTVTVDICPKVLDLRSKGKWITVHIELPEGYNVNDVNVSSILLNNTIPVKPKPTAIGDHDRDGISDLMVKFGRGEVISYILAHVSLKGLCKERFMTVTLTITGKFNNGTQLQGSKTIKITMPMPKCSRFTPHHMLHHFRHGSFPCNSVRFSLEYAYTRFR